MARQLHPPVDIPIKLGLFCPNFHSLRVPSDWRVLNSSTNQPDSLNSVISLQAQSASDLGSTEAIQRAALAKKKRAAALLLVGALLLLILGSLAESHHPHWGWRCLTAFAEAALVGGLADWFAVVALFRHPLGLKIPHTAIIPHKKDQIGENLADFVRDHFLGTQQLVQKIRSFDPAEKLAHTLTEPRNAERIAGFLTDSLPSLINLLDSKELQHFIQAAIQRKARHTDVSVLIGRFLDLLTHDGKHQEAVDSILEGLHEKLQSPGLHEALRDMIGKKVRAVGRFFNIDEHGATLLADLGVTAVKDVLGDRNHALRKEINSQVQQFVIRLRDDVELRAKIARQRDELVQNEAVAAYLQGLWGDVLDWLRDDLRREHSSIRLHVRKAALGVGALLASDPQIRLLFNTWCVETATPLIEDYREVMRNYIVERVKDWSAQELTEQLELSVGADLQYIRYNGTVIGGLIGLAIFGGLQLLHILF